MTNTILIADDHSIVRAGIKALIKDHLDAKQIDEAASENDIIRQLKATSYNLVMLDINLPGSDFVKLMEWIRCTSPETRILIFTMHTAEIYGKRCLQLGANGFLNKSASNTEMINALRKVLSGGTYIDETLQQLMTTSPKENKSGNPFDKLSTRELEIALLINKGLKLPDICSILNIQYSTANTYKRRIFEKLNVYNALSLSRLMQTFKIDE